MRLHPVKLAEGFAIALATVALGLGATGCGGKNQASTQTTSPSPTTSSSTAPHRGTTTTHHSSATAAHAATRCPAGELKGDIQLQQEGSAMVMVTNKGSRTCTLHGYLSYRGLGADNSAVTIHTKHEPHPGAPVTVTLKPGTTAFSGLKWTSCDKADASCKVLAGVQIIPPDESTHLTATVLGTDGKALLELPVSAAGFTAGSLQPASQGVVFP